MPQDVPNWKAEFEKLNAGPQGAATSSGGTTRRTKNPKFGVYDTTVKMYRRGATAIFGLARLNIEGVVLNLSEEGIDIATAEEILRDTRIHLRMEIAKFNDKIECDAVVLRCQKDPRKEDRYLVEVDFSNPDPALARKIGLMRGYFTSPEGLANRERRLREEKKNGGLFG